MSDDGPTKIGIVESKPVIPKSAQSEAESPQSISSRPEQRIPFTPIPEHEKAYPIGKYPTTGSIEAAIRQTLPPKPQRRYGFQLGLGKAGSILQLSIALFTGVGAALFLANAMVVYEKVCLLSVLIKDWQT